MPAPVHILLVEDDPADAGLISDLVAGAPSLPGALAHADRLDAALRHLQDHAVEAILLDLSLPDAAGLEALARLGDAAPATPIIVLSRTDDEDLAIAAVRAGAQDFLVKGHVTPGLLARAIRYGIERQRTEDQLAHRAYHDPLTGLPNRALFLDRVAQALAQARRNAAPVAVLFIDLDGFKTVNDTRGHAEGDALLREVARRLAGGVREGDTVARLGGDEFTVLLPVIIQEYDAAVVAQRLLELLAQPAPGRAAHGVTASIGINVTADGTGEVESLLQGADLAMYRAKASGKNRYAFFADELTRQIGARLALDDELRRAIAQDDLTLRLQPVAGLPHRHVLRFEALYHWSRSGVGIDHEQLLDLAEQSGAALLLDWALEKALGLAGAWESAGLEMGVALDLAPSTLLDAETPARVGRALTRHAVSPARLTLEVSEGAVMAGRDLAQPALARLAAIGVRLALDGFGHGPSALTQLKRLPLTEVKVDRALVGAMGTDDGDAAIVCALIGMIHALGLEAVADGVADDAALALLGAVGCDAAQGACIGAPLAPEDVAAWPRSRVGA